MNAMRRFMRYAGLWGLAHIYWKPVPSVLMYHSISTLNRAFFSVSPARFRQHLRLLREHGCEFVEMDAIAAWYAGKRELPRKVVCLTFDDGYRDNLTDALPLLEAFQCPATLYVTTNFVRDGSNHQGLPICSLDEIRRLSEHPLLTIGGHTASHPKLAGLPDDEVWLEITEGKRDLEAWIQQPVWHFAYPHGSYSASVIEQVRRAGFRTAVTTEPQHAGMHRNPYRIGRVSVEEALPLKLFSVNCLEAYTVYHRLKHRLTR